MTLVWRALFPSSAL